MSAGAAGRAARGASSTMGSAYSGVQTSEGRLMAGLQTTTAASSSWFSTWAISRLDLPETTCRSTAGWWRLSSSVARTSWLSAETMEPNCTVPASGASARVPCLACSYSATSWVAMGTSALPCSLSVTSLPWRANSLRLRSFSSVRICSPTATWVSATRWPAAVKEPSAATARKVRRMRRLGIEVLLSRFVRNSSFHQTVSIIKIAGNR